MERFERDSYINQTEAKFLAEMFNVQPEKVLTWFTRQRSKGTCTYNLQPVERKTKVIILCIVTCVYGRQK